LTEIVRFEGRHFVLFSFLRSLPHSYVKQSHSLHHLSMIICMRSLSGVITTRLQTPRNRSDCSD